MSRWFCLLPIALSIACGSDDSDGNPGNSSACIDQHITLTGSLDDQNVTADLEHTSFSFSQGPNSGDLNVAYAGGALKLDLEDNVLQGDTVGVTGTIQMPEGTPHAGETICAGDGSTFTPSDAGDRFALEALSIGPTCPGQAVAGSIRGCARSD